MPLLHWSTLEPHLPSNLAAVRFAAPIRVSALRIFPAGARPFLQVPDIIALATLLVLITNTKLIFHQVHRAQRILSPDLF